jgi:hypothetical protein
MPFASVVGEEHQQRRKKEDAIAGIKNPIFTK